jgi:hypothetical protein
MSMHESLPVAGYQPQSTERVDRVNVHKVLEERILRVIDELQSSGAGDPRWLAIARTDLEKGFMALNRAVFQPARIKLPGDDRPSVEELERILAEPDSKVQILPDGTVVRLGAELDQIQQGETT